MLALGRSRRLARLVAAWLLVWFAAMQGTALLRPTPAWSIAPASAASRAAAPAQHAHAEDCEEAHGQAPVHEDHTRANHLAQCPGCLFSTAPPPLPFALPQAPEASAPTATSIPPAAPRRQLLAQPPARGPPRFS